jgi:hypothetical protein
MAQSNYNPGPLTRQLQLWWSQQHLHPDDGGLAPLYRSPCGWGCGWQQGRTPDQIAGSLRPYLKVDAVQLAGVLQQPGAHVALAVANALTPTPVGLELTAVVDAIEAAGAMTVSERNRALAGLAVVGVALLFWFLFRD